MSQIENAVLNVLNELKISYEKIEHPPVFTVEEANKLCPITHFGCKNLFLRDRAKRNYYLLVMLDYKKANLKNISKELNIPGLTFSSEDALLSKLGLTPGSVSPFGLINDHQKEVTVLLDKDLAKSDLVSFHPNINTSTLTLSYNDFQRFLEWCNNSILKVAIPCVAAVTCE